MDRKMSLVQNEMPGKTQAPTASADPAHALETTQQSTDSGAIPEPKGPGGSHHATFSFLKTLNYCPPNCRWDNDHPRPLSWGLCLLFAFVRAPFDRSRDVCPLNFTRLERLQSPTCITVTQYSIFWPRTSTSHRRKPARFPH